MRARTGLPCGSNSVRLRANTLLLSPPLPPSSTCAPRACRGSRACRRPVRTARCGRSNRPAGPKDDGVGCRRPHDPERRHSIRTAGISGGSSAPDPPRSPNRPRSPPRPRESQRPHVIETAANPAARCAPARAHPSVSGRPDTSTGTGSRCSAAATWPDSRQTQSPESAGASGCGPAARAGAGSRPRRTGGNVGACYPRVKRKMLRFSRVKPKARSGNDDDR